MLKFCVCVVLTAFFPIPLLSRLTSPCTEKNLACVEGTLTQIASGAHFWQSVPGDCPEEGEDAGLLGIPNDKSYQLCSPPRVMLRLKENIGGDLPETVTSFLKLHVQL